VASPDLVLHKTHDLGSIFHIAASFGATQILDIALRADKARVEELLSTRDFSGRTPLDYAIENKQEAARIQLLNSEYQMPLVPRNLFEMADSEDFNISKMMAELQPATIDVYVVRKAIELGRSDIARILLENRTPAFSTVAEWESFLPLAVRMRQADLVEILVSKFPDSSFKFNEGRSVLSYNNPLSAIDEYLLSSSTSALDSQTTNPDASYLG
jgi:ankyrin repeat protein